MQDKDLHIVLIHGFGSNKNIWQHFAEALAERYTITAVELPGHGDAVDIEAHDLPAIAAYIAAQFNTPVIWLGWSLGALVAHYLATHYSAKTLGLITLAFNPKMVVGPDWPCGINPNAFKLLEKLFVTHPEQAMTRFLNLQTLGDNVSREVSDKIKASMRTHPTQQVFLRDFALLKNTDLRADADALACPQLNIFGDQDRIVPITVIEQLKTLCPRAQNVTIPNAAHLPFLSKEAECLTHINKFIHESITLS